MKNLKKILCLMLAAIFIFSVLSACGNADENSASTGTQSSAASSVQAEASSQAKSPGDYKAKISFWSAWADDAGPAQWVAEFNKVYPNIDVELVKYTNDDEGNVKIDTSLLAGIDVDVFFNYGAKRIDPRAKKGLVEDLSKYLEKDKFSIEEQYGEGAHQYGGKYFALPVSSQVDMMALNMSALEEAGLSVPKDWTIDEYREYAKKLTKGEGQNKVYGTSDSPPIQYWMLPAYSAVGANPYYNDKGLSNFDNPAFEKALQFKYDMENVEKIAMPFTEASITKVTAQDLLLKGQVAMVGAGAGVIRDLKNTEKYPRDFKVAFAPMPKLDENANNAQGTYFFGYLAMSSKLDQDKKDACWEFMKWLGTDGNIGLAQVGHLPSWRNVNKDKLLELFLGADADKLVDLESFKNVVLDYDHKSRAYDLTIFDAYNEIYTITNEEAELALYGEKSVSDAVKSMKTRSDEAITKLKQK